MKSTTQQTNQAATTRKRIAMFVQKLQRRCANFLSMHYEGLSEKAKKVSLVTFGIIMSGVSLYFMIGPKQQFRTLAEAAAKLPVVIPGQPRESLITIQEYKQLISFRRSLDSLRQVNPMMYSRVMHDRKGLLDSLDFLIGLYRKQ